MLTSNIYLYLLSFLVTKIMYSEGNLCSCSQPDSDFATGINLIYYKCNNETPATIAYPITAPQKLLKVLEDKRTIFYIFGYLENPTDEITQVMIKALCNGRTDNIVLLDWSKYSGGLYWEVVEKAKIVGSLLAESIRLLKDKNFNISTSYFVAHSLGAHIAGFVGKCNNFTLPRITALDPANPFIDPLGCYLKSTDASWIDVIHTDMGVYGTFTHMGTAEYYANGGTRPQPGCELVGIPLSKADFCSHTISVKIYAVSKLHPTEFTATKCSSYEEYENNKCKDNLHVNVGYAAPNVTGLFYFTTGIL